MKIKDVIKMSDEKNSEGKNLPLLGISMDKRFIPSVANVIGVDLSTYKLLKKGLFATNFIHVGRDSLVPIALYTDEDQAIVSPAYYVFEVADKSVLLPEYLMIWFRNSEFDREATFYASAGIRGGLDLDDFYNMEINVPPIEEQRRIVSEYQTLEARIKNNEALIQKLEETAQAIYHHTFVEGIDEENLPEGWRIFVAEDLFEISIGKTPPRESPEYFTFQNDGVKWVSIADMKKSIPFIFDTEEKLTEEAIDVHNIKIVEPFSILYSFKMTVGRVAITREKLCTNEAIANFKYNGLYYPYIYYFLKNINPDDLGNTSSITQAVNSKIIKKIKIIVPEKSLLGQFNNRIKHILEYQYSKQIENKHLYDLLSLLTSKLA